MTEPVSDALESRIRILSEENDSPCQKLSDGGGRRVVVGERRLTLSRTVTRGVLRWFAVFSCRRSFTYVNSSYAPKEMATPGILKP